MKTAYTLAENPEVAPIHPKRPLLITGLKYGVAGGVIAIVLFLALWALNENPLDAARLFDFFLIPFFIFFTLKEVRDYKQSGRLEYWQGMTAALFCYTTLAIISAIFIFIFLTYADTALLVRHQQESLAVLTDNPQQWIDEMGQQVYDQAIEGVKNISARDLALDDFFKKLLIGLFFAGIITLFIKK